jgi:AraC-like DNA-binding protein
MAASVLACFVKSKWRLCELFIAQIGIRWPGPASPANVADVDCAATLDAYLAGPVGRYLLGPTYAVWWHDAQLNGLLFWDRPEEDHVRRMTAALDGELAPGVAPHASLVDARRVRAVDLGAFTALSRYVEKRREAFSRIVTRQALLRPEGLAGAAIAGFYAILSPSYLVKVFTDSGEALEWLGADPCFTPELDALYEAGTGSPRLLILVRAYLEQQVGQATLQETARAFGMSPRQLQRKLREAMTCFQREDQLARVRVAKTLLVETSYDVKRIAIEVGCGSLQHFGAVFRKAEGVSPTQWRARRRSASV